METLTKPRRRAAVVFDSGIGGLNLLNACASRVPDLDYFFISDNKNVPYGNRSGEEILSLVLSALEGIEELNPAALVVACNTVTALCIATLRQRFAFPVVGIQPAVKPAAKAGGRCLVLATEATLKSSAFSHLVTDTVPQDKQPQMTVKACAGLADYVERNIFSLPETLPEGLLPNVETDSVVLGCTHYTYIKKQIEKFYNCAVFDGTEGTASHFAEIVGTGDHFCPYAGISDHFCSSKPKITFLRGDNAKNKLIYEKMFGK